MKLYEIISREYNLSPWSDFIGKPVKLMSIYDKKNRDVGLLSKATAQTVVVTNTKTKQIVGKRTVFLKEPGSSKARLPYDDPAYSSIVRRNS